MHHIHQETKMNVISRVALHATVVAAVALPCPAFALENGGTTNAAPNPGAQEPPSPAPNRGTTRDTGNQEQKPGGSRRTDHFRIGVLGGVGFPRPLSIEAFAKIERIVGLGVEYSVLPTLDVSGVETSFYAVAADARIFPFRDAFFVGLRAGRQHLGAHSDIAIQGYGVVREALSVDSTFINPRLGFLWTWDPGVTLGIDIGVQIPVASSSTSSIPRSSLPASVTVDDDIVRVTNTVGKYVLPTVDLLKIGFLL
jgi:hypothetical protein